MINYENAYDSILWEYLDTSMRFLSFRDKWVALISCFISSTTSLVLMNGSPISVLHGLNGGFYDTQPTTVLGDAWPRIMLAALKMHDRGMVPLNCLRKCIGKVRKLNFGVKYCVNMKSL